MKPQDLRLRTRQFALDVIFLFRELPRTPDYQEIGRQLLRAANAVASNYRASGRARSRAEFIAKLGTVREESDESEHWLEMLTLMGLKSGRLAPLVAESAELIAIFAASYNTAVTNRALLQRDSRRT